MIARRRILSLRQKKHDSMNDSLLKKYNTMLKSKEAAHNQALKEMIQARINKLQKEKKQSLTEMEDKIAKHEQKWAEYQKVLKSRWALWEKKHENKIAIEKAKFRKTWKDQTSKYW